MQSNGRIRAAEIYYPILKKLNSFETIIRNAFPSFLQEDVEEVIKVLPLEQSILLTNGEFHKIENLISRDQQPVSLNGESLNIPGRVYFDEPAAEQTNYLTPIQRTILNCIYLRHHNGHVRQRRLEQMTKSSEYFTTPFTFHLLGDYVMEILEVLDKQVSSQVLINYTRFIKENKKYWQQTESRMTSYWNEYYRQPKFPMLKDYVGRKIVKRIKEKL